MLTLSGKIMLGNQKMKKGLLIIYSGPSAVGKDTLLKELLNDPELKIALSVSMTTRAPRNGEKEGVDYFYVSNERFEEAIKNNELLEYAKYVDHYYGTPLNYVEKNRNEGKNVVLVIEIEGAKKVLEKVKDNVISIYVVPPTMEELEKRMRLRNIDSEESIIKRLNKAKDELSKIDFYDYKVVNDDLKRAANEVRSIILKEQNKI